MESDKPEVNASASTSPTEDKLRDAFMEQSLSEIRKRIGSVLRQHRLSLPDTDVEDLVQDVMLRLLTSPTPKFSKSRLHSAARKALQEKVTKEAEHLDAQVPTRFIPWRPGDYSSSAKSRIYRVLKDHLAPLPEQWLSIVDTEPLSPEYLSDQLLPYLQALFQMQFVCDVLQGRSRNRAVIREISQRSPVGVSLEGVGDAINSVKEEVIPWRKENAKKVAALNAVDAEVEIKKKKAEAAEARARSAKTRAEATKLLAEAEKVREEAEAQRVTL